MCYTSALTVCLNLRSGFEPVSELILFLSDKQEIREALLLNLKYVIWNVLVHIIPDDYDLVQ